MTICANISMHKRVNVCAFALFYLFLTFFKNFRISCLFLSISQSSFSYEVSLQISVSSVKSKSYHEPNNLLYATMLTVLTISRSLVSVKGGVSSIGESCHFVHLSFFHIRSLLKLLLHSECATFIEQVRSIALTQIFSKISFLPSLFKPLSSET